jgi:predicted dehydrogenase
VADPPAGFANAFRAQWERFLRHVAADEPFPWDLLEGAKGVQLAELAHASARERRWMDVPPLARQARSEEPPCRREL